MQLCIVDAISPYSAITEILAINNQSWIFSSEVCLFYNGIEILVNTLAVWFIICLNFQGVSIWNLQKNQMKNEGRNPLTSCEEDESVECLVTRKENRVISINYNKRKSDISVIVPTIFIWFSCVSLSIPNFVLSSTLKIKASQILCAIVDSFYGYILQLLLIMFRVVLPIPLLLLSFVLIAIKLSKTSIDDIDNIVTKEFIEIKSLIMYCVSISILFILTSFQRNVFYVLHIKSHSFGGNATEIFKLPPLYNNHLNVNQSMGLSMLHYSSNTIRVILCFLFLPKFGLLVKNKIFVCCKPKN